MYSEKNTTARITAAASFMGKVPSGAPVAKMGPNGIIQTFNAIASQFGENAAQQALLTAGLEKYIAERPHEMVDEREFHRLVHSVCEHFDEDARNTILLNAGEGTAHYLLQARIPRPSSFCLTLADTLGSQTLALVYCQTRLDLCRQRRILLPSSFWH